MQKSNDFSINLMIPFLRYFGFWMPSGRDQETFYYFLLFISYVQICLIVIGAMYEILFHFTDLTTWLYCLITFVSSFTSFFKLTAILPHRKDFFHLILYLQKNFLDSKYNDHERSLLTACKQTSTLFICTFIFFTYTTVIGYILGPFIENRGKNESDRILILSVRMDVFSFSPYYEIMYAVQAVCVLKVGVVYHSYDNFLYIMNLHVTTQFRILHRRLESLASDYCSGTVVRIASDSASNGPHDGEECYATFRKYIQHHQSLLAYCKKLNKVFNVYALGQVILFTLILCFDAYQVLMAGAPASKKVTFVFHMLGCLAQLFMFTYCCDGLIQESENVAASAYTVPWMNLPMNRPGKLMRDNLKFILLKSTVPCHITAYKFFPVSLETYTKVLSTGVSYFTLLKQSTESNA
ncbi:odorant receptor 10-like isoform X1 [Megalopta genalis]|uniref:odorant receptor 10-like isoform X1 n=1 Tax=Megalopta genalis TaxID=115081 RepID=UPI003FD39604